MEGDLCGVCYQGLLELHQGALVCTFCGSFHAVSPTLALE